MHKYPQISTYVGSSGQTLTTNVSMTLCNWQFRHQTQVLCGCIIFVPNQIPPPPHCQWPGPCFFFREGGGHLQRGPCFFTKGGRLTRARGAIDANSHQNSKKNICVCIL